jgi:glycine cleavage system H protein
MNFPSDCRYTPEHEWVKIENNSIALVGITDFAQSELGDIVFIEIETQGQDLGANDIFGTVEAVKTVSDLFLPLKGKVLEVNPKLADQPEIVNEDPYGEGWMIKMEIEDLSTFESLMDVDQYKSSIGQ